MELNADENNENAILLESVHVVDPVERTSASFDNLEVYYTLEKLEKYDVSTISKHHIFEKLCHTPKNGSQIALCLGKGCDPHKQSTKCHHFPIHCAAESGCAYNLFNLLDRDPSIIDQVDSMQRTALHIIIQSIDANNFKTSFETIRTVMQFNPDFNCHHLSTVDTPLNFIIRLHSKIGDVIKEEWQAMLQLIDEQVHLIDLNLLKQDDVQNILQSCCPALWEKWTVDMSVDHPKTIVCELLFSGDEKKMIRTLYTISKDPEHDNTIKEIIADGDLINIAIKREHVLSIKFFFEIFKRFITKEIFDKIINRATCYPVRDSSLNELLDIWLEFGYGIYKTQILRMITSESTYDMLLSHPAIDLNIVDNEGCSSLTYHIYAKKKLGIQKLLQKNAFIGILNSKNKMIPMEIIDPKMLEEHFDSCIRTLERQVITPMDKWEYIEYNYTCLKPPPEYRATVNELTAINCIAANEKLRHLILHPVITSFLLLKWNLLCPFFYLNLFVYSINFIMLIAYMAFCYGQKDTSNGFALIPIIFSLTIAIREIFQFILSHKRYFTSFSNYVELLLIGLTLIITFHRFELDSNRRAMGALTILFAAMELVFLFGTIPIFSLSLYMRMLKKVTVTFIHAFALYSVILLAFASSFYTLFGLYGDQEIDSSTKLDNSLEFTNPAFALLKTIVMFTGEFDASDLNFEMSNWIGYVIFMIFVFFVAIIMMNLLSGLAVSDTQQIISDASLDDFIVRAQLLELFEHILITNKILDDLIPDELKSHIVQIPMNNSAKEIYPSNALDFNNDRSDSTSMPLKAVTKYRFSVKKCLKRYLKQWTVLFLKNFSTSQSDIVRESLQIFEKCMNKKQDPSKNYEEKLKEEFKRQEIIIEEKYNKLLQKVEKFKIKEQENYENELKEGLKRVELLEKQSSEVLLLLRSIANKDN